MKVRGVNIASSRKVPHNPVFCLIPVSTENPAINSAVHRSMARGRLRSVKKSEIESLEIIMKFISSAKRINCFYNT